MKIIEPSATLVGEINPEEILKKIERCGRVSRQSGGRPLNTYGAKKRTKNFMRMLIERGHESVLEHASLTFHIICDRAIMAELTRHRIAAFTVESTRYVKYDDLEVVTPFAIDDDEILSLAHLINHADFHAAEKMIISLLTRLGYLGEPPQNDTLLTLDELLSIAGNHGEVQEYVGHRAEKFLE